MENRLREEQSRNRGNQSVGCYHLEDGKILVDNTTVVTEGTEKSRQTGELWEEKRWNLVNENYRECRGSQGQFSSIWFGQ